MKIKQTIKEYKCAVFSLGCVAVIPMFVFISTIMDDRCQMPEAMAEKTGRCGHPFINWLYDFQSLLAGVFATIAAIATIYEMKKNTKLMSEIANRNYNRAIVRAHEMLLDSGLETLTLVKRFGDAVSGLGLLINARRLSKSLEDTIRIIDRIEDENWDIEFSFSFRLFKRELKDNVSWLEKVYGDNFEKIRNHSGDIDDTALFFQRIKMIGTRNEVLMRKVEESKNEFLAKHPEGQ